jgi:protein O-mannosyl-transferase
MSSLAPPARIEGAAPEPSTPVNGSGRARQTERSIGAVLVLVTLLVYLPALSCSFLQWGDSDYVTENRHVQAGLTAENVRWAFTTLEAGNWHPLTWLSLLLDTSLYGGQSSAGFHFTNVVLHTLSTLVLFLFLSRATGAVWRSAVVAALFALHPLQVEAVAWVGERKGVLSTLFWMLALAAYVSYVRRRGVGRYLLVVLMLALGLMAKPMLVTLPFVLLLLDYWPLNRRGVFQGADGPALPSSGRPPESWRFLLLEKLPLILLVLTWSVLTFIAEMQIGALPTLRRFPLDVRIWNALLAYVEYLGKAAYPVGLAAFYPHPGRTVAVGPALGAGLLLVAITAVVLGPGRRWPYLAVGWLWYLGTLVPVIGLVQVLTYRLADRYAYVPLVGLFLALTWGASDWAAARRWPRPFLIATTVVILGICAARTWVQLGYWQNDRDLWEHAAAVTERNAMAHNFLGLDFARTGMVNQAEQELQKAVAFDPEYHLFHYNLATQLRELGRKEEAVAECRKAADLQPKAGLYHFTLGDLLRDLGREDEALAEYQEAVRIDPGSAVAHTSVANLLLDMGRRPEALAEYHKALELQPGYPAAHVGLGNFFATLGKREEALTEFRLAIDLDPRRPVPHVNLGRVLQELGRLDEAIEEYGRAFDLGSPAAGHRLRTCERLRGLLPRLPDLVTDRVRLETNAERLAFAALCSQPFAGRYALAVRLYTAVFGTDPGLGEDVRTGLRYEAAVAAAQAGCGQGLDAAGLDPREKAQLRQQARAWLQAELRDWTNLLQRNSPADRAAVRQALRVWQREIGLEGVREAATLRQLPEAEREAWQQLWQNVREVRAMASPRV